MQRETDLYAPVKAFLEARGYAVKAEIGAADLVGVAPGGGDPVVVELKLRLLAGALPSGGGAAAADAAGLYGGAAARGAGWRRGRWRDNPRCAGGWGWGC